MDTTKIIGGIKIKTSTWKKNGHHRVYFNEISRSRNAGQACWDMIERKWIKVHCEFGPKFKMRIKVAFGCKIQ